jgi:hypothetical protein
MLLLVMQPAAEYIRDSDTLDHILLWTFTQNIARGLQNIWEHGNQWAL